MSPPLKLSRVTFILTAVVLVMSACTLTSAAIPKNYPLPIYPGAGMPPDGYHELLGARSLVLKTRDSSASAHRFYVDKLKDGGWQITNDKKIEETYLIEAARDKENANVTIQANVIILTWIKRGTGVPAEDGGSDPRSAAVDRQPAI
ncbi:MAG: hypothetical protein C5B53_02360 [Candidatus Melainabacteria bacterium]|nr:MAG: hypothetical protein C5B53_02360 [Candidatus Melainabacteria bacterium]